MTSLWLPRLQPPVEPCTARLQLRQWRAADVEAFAALNADPAAMAYFPSTLSRSASEALMHWLQGQIEEQGWGPWAVALRQSGAFVGFIGLQVVAPSRPRSPCVEVVWRLAPTHWGQGYSTEGAAAALAFGFQSLALARIVAFTAVGNHRSRAVMARLGMADTGETFEHPGLPNGSALRTHCLHQLTHADWARNPLAPH